MIHTVLFDLDGTLLNTIDTAFKYNSFGMAATMAVAIMAIVILVYVFQNVVLKKVFNQEEAA